MTLPGTDTWSQFGFGPSGPAIRLSSPAQLASADNGTFTIASVSGDTLTLTQSFVLTAETQGGVTVGDGIIGQASAPIALSDVPLFIAAASDGAVYLEPGSAVDSTAVNVYAGELNGVANGVSVTSEAEFLTIEYLQATGEAAVTVNNGALLEYSPNGVTHGLIIGQTVSLTSPFNIGTASSPIETQATSGLTVDATATSPSSAGIYIDNIATSLLTAIGVITYDGSVTILSAATGTTPELSFDNSQLSETGTAVVTFANTDDDDGSDGDVIVSGPVYVSGIVAGIGADGTAGAGQILTNSTTQGTINGDNGTVILSAGSGIGVSGTPLNITSVATLDATTNTGDIDVTNKTSPITTSAAAVTTPGSVTVTPVIMDPYITVGASLLIDAGLSDQETVTVTAVTTTTFTAEFADTHPANFTISISTLTLSASTSAGNIDVTSKYGIDLASEMSSTTGVVLDSISARGQ